MKWERPSFMKNATRHAYQQPGAVGWAAWWTLFDGVIDDPPVVAFEHLDGTIVYSWE